MSYYFYSPLENKIVVASYAKFLEKNLISQEASGRAVELEKIQDEDTSPSENTSKIPIEVEVEEYSLGDLNEPTNYKAALLDLESNKWLDAINAKNQSMKDNQVWRLVDLPPNGASTPEEVKRMQNVPYASAVGSIMYAVRCTRPDVVFAQNITSRFQQNPSEPYWTAVKNILKYLRNTKDMFLVYDGNLKLSLELLAIAMLDSIPIEMT
ncbi:hypothetical protein Tco_1192746 [Tanacetum coccineum]